MRRILGPLLVVSLIGAGAQANPLQKCADWLSVNQRIELANGESIRVRYRSDGSGFIYLFPFVRTDIEFINHEPYVTVYRGLKDSFDLSRKSIVFGDYIYASLKLDVALRYMSRTNGFRTPESISLLRMRLPLRKAYVAKADRLAASLGYWKGDQYTRALENRKYIWVKWRAPERRKDRELVWNIKELEPSEYQVDVISALVPPSPHGPLAWHNPHYQEASENVRQAARENRWIKIR